MLVLSVIFLALNVLVPLPTVDFYPFTTVPMFSETFEVHCEYQVFDPSGLELTALSFGLHLNHGGNPIGFRGGTEQPATLNSFGEIQSEAEVAAHVQEQLKEWPDLAFVRVVQQVVGPVSEKQVGVVERHEWVIPNPAHLESDPPSGRSTGD